MKASFTMPYTESSITLNFPDLNYFCFENCSAYQRLSSAYFKEMDACWIDVTNKVVYIVELKDFSLADTNTIQSKILDLVKKSIDSYTMLVSILLETPFSNEIKSCLPVLFDKSYKIQLLHIIHCRQEQRADIQFIKNSFEAKFKPYKTIFNLEKCTILTYEQAKRYLAWVN